MNGKRFTMDKFQSLKEYKRRICLAMKFIEDNLEDSPGLDEIAESAFFSKFHFHRIFSEIVGETIAEYTRRLKLEKAANKLIFSNMEITEIAYACGFSSSQNFSRAFKKHFQLTPTKYRKENTQIKQEAKQGLQLFEFNNSIANSGTEKKIISMDVKVKDMPSYYVAYVRGIGEYSPETCLGAHEKIIKWAMTREFIKKDTLSIGIGHDNPDITPHDKCRYEACITIPENAPIDTEISVQTIPPGRYAVYSADIGIGEFSEKWSDLIKIWLPSSGYQPDARPFYEICHNNISMNTSRFSIDFCCPIKPL